MSEITESTKSAMKPLTERVQNVLQENRSWEAKFSPLVKAMEVKAAPGTSAYTKQLRESQIAGKTLLAMRNQKTFLEQNRNNRVIEATFVQSLNTLVPKIVDIVGIFYPNLVAHDLVDIQPLDRQNGEIFTVKPVYSNTASGVTRGEQVFQNVTEGTYASSSITFNAATGDGTTVTFTGTLVTLPVTPGTVQFVAGTQTASDDSQGNLVGPGITGTVNYATGAYSVTFTTAPAVAVPVLVNYNYDYQVSGVTNINELEINMGIIQITAEAHPLRINFAI